MGWLRLSKVVALGVALVAAPGVGAAIEPTMDDDGEGPVTNRSALEVAAHRPVATATGSTAAARNAPLGAELRRARVDRLLGCSGGGCDTNSPIVASAAIAKQSASEVAAPIARSEPRYRAVPRHHSPQPVSEHAPVATATVSTAAPRNALLRAELRRARIDVELGCTLDGCDGNSPVVDAAVISVKGPR